MTAPWRRWQAHLPLLHAKETQLPADGLRGLSDENVLEKGSYDRHGRALVMAMHRGYWHGPSVKLLDCS